MLHHVSVGVHDVERAAKFYDPVLKTLGYKRIMEFLPYAIGYGERGGNAEFWIQLPHNQQPATSGNGTHVGFSARSKGQVNAFHAAALAQGGSNDGEPGPRPDYGPAYYGAFIYDLDGNKIEATLTAPAKAAAKPRSTRKTAKRSIGPKRKPQKKAKKKKARRR
ncbi:MAG TPA: VOC family protein [Rhizomicrobium sp.]|jgi:catechol 2,3-dioxygenase-like lactoylglutathione lyase family enzyme|nr:VOC family protein [Rhizomicrobium sp.]